MKRTTDQSSCLRYLIGLIDTFPVLSSEITPQTDERVVSTFGHSKPREVQLSAILDAPQTLKAKPLRVFEVGKNVLRERRVFASSSHSSDALLLC